MSKLTVEIQMAGLHDCSCGIYAISERESKAIIEAVKAECIEAVEGCDVSNSQYPAFIGRMDAIKAIQEVE